MADVLWSNPNEHEVFWSDCNYFTFIDAQDTYIGADPVDLQTSNESTENKIEIHALANPAFEKFELNVQSSTGAVQGSQYTFLNPEYMVCLSSIQVMVGP